MARTLRSDNNAGLCPEAVAALIAANDGHAIAYGDDPRTAEARAAFRAVLGEEAKVWLVATGTAANTLAIASLTEPWQQVLCHEHSHYNADESTAPERFTSCRAVPLVTEGSKLTPAMIRTAVSRCRDDVHMPQAGVLTISNPTEFGTVYSPAETRALCEIAHEAGYRVHVDGARFANAIAALGCPPRDLSIDAGVDALSFGGTKNGLALGEAVCFFPQGDGSAFRRATASFEFHRKSTGHLLSKHRFVSAPFAATLRDDAWLRHAAHANAMARRLADGLSSKGLTPRFATEANGVFVELPDPLDRCLRERGHQYYPFGDPSWRMYRLMCSFDTTTDDVDAFVSDVGEGKGLRG